MQKIKKNRINNSPGNRSAICVLLLGLSLVCLPRTAHSQEKTQISDSLCVVQLSPGVLLHVSEESSKEFGRYSCNGLIYINNSEAVVIDTPPDEILSKQLYDWFRGKFPDVRIKAIIATHFHADCLGGLDFFHRQGITSYAHTLTPQLLKLKQDPYPAPEHTFDSLFTLDIGGKKVTGHYFGEAHTRDNIVTWIEAEKILFGGCMVKSLKSGKGNLADANVKSWSQTVKKVKKKFPSSRIVIPGHGSHGGLDLLDYTIELFGPENK